MASIPVITDPKDYLGVARQIAEALNEVVGQQFEQAREGEYEVGDLDLGLLASLAQVNYLGAIAESLNKIGG